MLVTVHVRMKRSDQIGAREGGLQSISHQPKFCCTIFISALLLLFARRLLVHVGRLQLLWFVQLELLLFGLWLRLILFGLRLCCLLNKHHSVHAQCFVLCLGDCRYSHRDFRLESFTQAQSLVWPRLRTTLLLTPTHSMTPKITP